MKHKSYSALVLVPILLAGQACDKRTAEEKGRDLASEKLDLAKGAADVLKEKGGVLGKTTGQGVTDLIKGVGSGVKDSVNPPVKVELEKSASEAGVAVTSAHEGTGDATARNIEVYGTFAKPFRGRLELRAFDEQGAEIGQGVSEKQLDLPKDSVELLQFRFPVSMRFTHAKVYRLRSTAASDFSLHEALTDIDVSQVNENATTVSAYFKFQKKFAGGLELRAYDSDGKEVGRSSPSAKLKQAPDSATYVEFTFDPRTPLTRTAKYEVRRVEVAK